MATQQPVEPAGPAAAGFPRGGRLIDLTHPFDETRLYCPTSPSGFVLRSLFHGKTPGGFFYAANQMAAPEHGGTHLDSPIHCTSPVSRAARRSSWWRGRSRRSAPRGAVAIALPMKIRGGSGGPLRIVAWVP